MSDFGADGGYRPPGEPPHQSWRPPPPANRTPPTNPATPPPGNYGAPPPRAFGPPPGDYGASPARNYGGPPTGNYGPPAGDYGPPAGNYGGPAAGDYGGPPTGNYGAPGGSYDTPPHGWAYPPGPAGPGGRLDQLQGLPAYVEPPRRGRGRAAIAVIATATAVVLTAGGVYAFSALSGGAAQLAEHTPGDAVGYLEVNLDPPAAQKVAAIRFLHKFPAAKAGDEDGSLIESVVEPLLPDAKTRRLFTEDIKPWLGKHAAVAADPQDGKVKAVIIAETADEAKTRTGLDRFNAEQTKEADKVRYAFAGGLVYLAETQQATETAARDAGSGTLADNGTFTADVDKVGADGIVTFWADLAAAAKFDPDDSASAQGRLAGSLRFTDTTADLRIRALGNPAKTGTQPVGPRLATLPADTAAAFGLSGGDKLVRSAYDQLEKVGLGSMLEKAERDSGLRLPDDVAALVGSTTVIALGGTREKGGFGMVSTTDDPAGARRVVDKILRKVDEDDPLTMRATPDGVVLATPAAYADQLTGHGTLGEQQLFNDALPDVDGATAVVFVDVRRVAEIYGRQVPDEGKAVSAFGLTVSTSGDESGIHMRLVAG